MRRAVPRRAFPACAVPDGYVPRSALARRLRLLATLVDDTLVGLGAEPAFAEGSGRTTSSDLRTRRFDPGPRAGGRRPSDGARNGRVDHAADDDGRSERPGEPDGDGADGPDSHEDASPDIAEDHVETWRLVEQAQAGDGEAYGLLYDRYVVMVYKFVYFKIHDRSLAEDFTSETFLRGLRRISTITYQGRDIGAWFMTIARNIVLDHMKSARNRLETTTGETLESREHAPSTEDAVLTNLQNDQLMAAVAQLGDEQRECVTLRFIHGLSVSETAGVMGKNDGAIKALQHRAVRKLADLVDRP